MHKYPQSVDHLKMKHHKQVNIFLVHGQFGLCHYQWLLVWHEGRGILSSGYTFLVMEVTPRIWKGIPINMPVIIWTYASFSPI